MLCIYKSMVLPYFDYADVVVSNASTFYRVNFKAYKKDVC